MNLPPEGDLDVGMFAYFLFYEAWQEKERLELPARWKHNHRLYRGDHWKDTIRSQDNRFHTTVNLYFANVNRTVANVTARKPVAEVISVDGVKDEIDKIFSEKLYKWYQETEQQDLLGTSALNMENYGITIEKGIYNYSKRRPEVIVVDPYAFFPAPGNYDDLDDCPYIVHAYPVPVETIERLFNVVGVEAEDVVSIMGEDREENRPMPYGSRIGARNYPGNYTDTQWPSYQQRNYRERRALLCEVWVRDYSTVEVEVEMPTVDIDTGDVVSMEITTRKMPKYPGGIRVITFTNHGRLVLKDRGNPNINGFLPTEFSSQSYLWDHWPFYKSNSYRDTTSLWGFSAAEQVGDLNFKINEILSRIASYIGRVTMPPLILPKDTDIPRGAINNKPGLVLQPASSLGSREIRFLQVPNLPSNFFDILKMYLGFFDRIYQIEDADRGESPGNVIAASAIYALQERNMVMIRKKVEAVDFLVRQRGRCAISFFQNFHITPETISLNDQSVTFRGVDHAGRKFNYVVESGSTYARSSLQTQEDAKALYQMGAIDRQALLEAMNYPDRNRILERVGEGQLNQALQILVQAGMSQDEAMELRQQLMEPQGGPGKGTGSAGAPAQPGIPKAMQGGGRA